MKTLHIEASERKTFMLKHGLISAQPKKNKKCTDQSIHRKLQTKSNESSKVKLRKHKNIYLDNFKSSKCFHGQM